MNFQKQNEPTHDIEDIVAIAATKIVNEIFIKGQR